MSEQLAKAGLIEPINQAGHLWLETAIAQFKFVNQCCQQVSGCCQRVSRQLSLEELVREFAAKKQ